MGFILLEPIISSGKVLLFFSLNATPNLLSGCAILLKSLLDKLLSPINLIVLFDLTKSPRISLPSVPEFLALICKLFL